MILNIMWGTGSEADNRGVSEIYGTVIVISITFVMAIFLVGIGYYVIGDITSDTEDRVSQDSMQELNDRISEVAGSPTDATTAFQFPHAADNIEADDEAGSVEITVNSSKLGADYLKGERNTSQASFDLGTVTFESEDGATYGLQGGGQWETNSDSTSMISPPPFEYDGESLNLGFTSLGSAGSFSPGTEATIASDADVSVEASEEVASVLNEVWTVQPDGLEAVGSDLVDVTIEIESEFAEGWKRYAENELDEEPTNVSYNEDSEVVTIEFDQVGTELPEDVTSTPDDWESKNVLYAGNSSYAIFNSIIEPVGSSFVIDQSATSEYTHAVDLEEDDKQVYIAIPNPDHEELDAGATYDGTTWETIEPGEDEFTVEDRYLRNFSLENQLTPGYREITSLSSSEFEHDSLDAAELFNHDNHVVEYELADSQEICILVAEEFPGEGDPEPPGNAYGLEGYGPDTETYEQCGMDSVPRESPSLDINSVEPVDADSWDDVGSLDEADIDPLDVEVNVTNTGGVGTASALLEAQIPTETAETDFLPVDEADVADINRTESKTVELTWEPSTTELSDINMSDELDGESAVRVNTGAEEMVGGEVDVLYEPPPTEYFELHGADAEVSVSGENASEVESVDTVQNDVVVEIPVNNTGKTEGEQTVTLWYDDGSGDSPAATETVSLEAGEEELVTFEWGMDNLGFGVDEISVGVTSDDDRETLQELQDVLSADFGVTISDDELEVLEGQTLEVPVDVENRGAAQDEQEIELIAPEIGQTASTTVNLSGNEEVRTSIEMETAVDDATDSVEVEVSSSERMATESVTIHPEPEIEDTLRDDENRETLPTNWHYDASEDDGLDDDVQAIVDYQADWWIEEFSFEWGEGSCGLFCTEYYLEAMELHVESDVDDPAESLEPEGLYDELYAVNYNVIAVGEEIDGFEYEDSNPVDESDVREALNEGFSDGTFELTESLDATTGDNYFPIKIEMVIIDDTGEPVDSDSIVIPMGTSDDDGEIEASQ